MPGDIDVNRFALVAILVAANAKHPAEYPDYETLNAMSDSGLLGYADGLLYSLELRNVRFPLPLQTRMVCGERLWERADWSPFARSEAPR